MDRYKCQYTLYKIKNASFLNIQCSWGIRQLAMNKLSKDEKQNYFSCRFIGLEFGQYKLNQKVQIYISIYSLKILNILQGIELPGYEGKSQLSQQLVDEAAIVSDMFKLNQISALQLLLHGEDQLPQYPGITQIRSEKIRI